MSPYQRVMDSERDRRAESDRQEAATAALELPGIIQLSERRYAVVKRAGFTTTSAPGASLMPIVVYQLATKPDSYAQTLAALARARAEDQPAAQELCGIDLIRGMDGRLRTIHTPCILPAGHTGRHEATPELEEGMSHV